jgi:hypothetical protein
MFLPSKIGGDSNQQVCNHVIKCIDAASIKICQTIVENMESTTLVTNSSRVIVQRWYCAGPNLDRARGARLDTKEVTTHHQNQSTNTRNNPFLFPFLFFFFLFSFFLYFFSFFQVTKIFCLTTKIKGLCIQPVPTHIDKSYIRQPNAQIFKSILERLDGVYD